MDNTIDSLQIDIVESATTADKSIDALVSSLKKLDRIGKSNSFSIIQKQLKGIAKVNFDTLESQITSITKNLDKLKSYQNFLNNINLGTPTIDTTAVSAGVDSAVAEVNRAREEVLNVGERFGEAANTRPEWLDDVQTQCDTIIGSYQSSIDSLNATKTQITTMLAEKKADFGDQSAFIGATDFTDTLADKMAKLDLSATLLVQRMEQLKESGNIDTTSWFNLQKQLLALKLQYSQLEQAAKKHSRAVDSLGKSVKKTKQPLGKLISKFGNVMMYRMIRYLLSQIMQAVTEGFQNMAKFSNEANRVMSAYKTEFLYIKNSLGSALMPIMESLLPTVIRLGDAFVDITNSIGLISAGIAGKDTFLQAKKYAQDYKKSLDDIKRATVGFDEINVLSKPDVNNDYTQMFEEVEFSGWDVAGAIAKITALVASILTLTLAIKGIKIGDVFTKMGKGLKNSYNSIKNTSVWKKAALSVALLAGEAIICHNAIYDMATGTKSVGQGLLELIPILALVGVAMYAMWGPVGLIIGAVVAVISGVVGGIKAVSEAAKDREMEKFWKVGGVAIEQCTAQLENYFRALGIGQQQEWNDTLNAANAELTDAIFNYNTLWASVQGDNVSTKKIQQLSDAFQSLANAANAVNEAAIGSLMASIKTGIEMNITPELTARLGGLVNSLEAAQDLLSVKVNGLNAEYQQVLNEVASNGGNITSEQRTKLEQLKAEMNKFTLSDNTAAESWSMSLQEAKNAGINAGFNKDDVASSLDDLIADRDEYLAILKTNYASSVSTLKQLIQLDKTEFGGALGFSDADLATLAESYNAQLEAVNKQFNDVIWGVYNGLNANAMSDPGNFWKDISAWAWNWGYYGEKDAYKEQQDILKMIKDYLGSVDDMKVDVPAHANGGFPEDGLFMANHTELVGKFTNGKTAVANNAQIVEGIKQGVMEAMSESGGNDGGNWVIQVVDTNGEVKGETIITTAERKNRRDGKTVIAVGG